MQVASVFVPHNPARVRARAIVGTTLVLVLAAAGYLIYHSFRNVTAAPPPPGCQAGTGVQSIDLDPEQAAVAATIAGVAARHELPRQAVTVALAAALQESKLHNLGYGDRDSVGIFQQRPSEGWGSATDLQDPVYATTKFYAALTQVHGYVKMPVYQAAQDVQHSADGSAYQQWTDVAGELAGYFTGKSPHGVSCWYTPSGQANLAGAERQIRQTFGPAGPKAVVVRITMNRSGQKDARSTAVLHVQRAAAWTVASWLVAHAETYHLSEVRYAGFTWKAANGNMGWQRVSDPTSPSGKNGIVAG
jgi:hypothetical protein